MDLDESSYRGKDIFKNNHWITDNDCCNLAFKNVEETEDCAYLGDKPSVHDFTKYSVKEFRLLKPFDKRHSLDSLNFENAIPFLMKLPVISSKSTMVDLLESISALSWMLPFILASSPPLNSKNIPKLILSCNTEHLRLLHNLNGVKGSFSSLPTIIEDQSTLLKNNITAKPEIIRRIESEEHFVANISSSPSVALHSSPTDSTAVAIAHNGNNNLNGHGLQNRIKFPKPCYYLNDSIISSESLISSWKNLGTILISNDSKLWELRDIMLFNNYLFECSSQSTMTIIGFACLNQANIRLADYSPISSNTHPHNQYARTRSESDDGLPSAIIEISYLRTCSITSQRGNVYIRCATAKDTEAIKNEIMQSAKLSLEQLFKINYNDEKNNLLSKGRFTEVRKAIRKYQSNSDACLNELFFENASNKSSIQAKYHLDIATLQGNVDLSLMSLEGGGGGTSQRGNVYIRCATAKDTKAIKNEIMQSAELSLEQLFKINYNDEKNNLLSKGRFTEVRKAIRKYQSNSDACLNELFFENASKKSSIQAKYHLDIATLQGDVDLSLMSLEGGDGGGGTSSAIKGDQNIVTSNGETTRTPIPMKNSHSLSQLMTRPALSNFYTLLPAITAAFKSSSKVTRNRLLTNKNHHHQQQQQQQQQGQLSYLSPVECALKIIQRDQFAERVESGRERADCLVRETLAQTLVCRIGKQLGLEEEDLPVVGLNCIFETTDLVCLDLELMQDKDLLEVFQSNEAFPEALVKSVVTQMVKSLILCRLAGVVHRDVKLSNITVAKTTGTAEETEEFYEKNFRVKLADFGMAGFCDKEGRIKGRCGTLGYVAPEILNTEANEWYFGAHADVFSLGVVAYTLLVGYEPFTGRDDSELKEANRAVLLDFNRVDWRKVSWEAVDWISRAMHPNPKQRLSPDDALKHPWLLDPATA